MSGADSREGWLRLSSAAPPREELHLLAGVFRQAGCRAVERVDDRVVGYLPVAEAEGTLDEVVAGLRAGIRAATSLANPAVRVEREEGTGWRHRQQGELRWRKISERLAVAPIAAGSGDPPDVADTPHTIFLHSGPAFGSAEHGSTRGALRLVDAAVGEGDRLVDVGAGSGVLSIGATLLGAASVLALEVDPLAGATARDNVRANGVEGRVRVKTVRATSEGLPALLEAEGATELDGALANLEAELLLPLLPALGPAVRGGGWLVLAGLHRGEGAKLIHDAPALGLDLRDSHVDDGWWSGLFERVG